MDAPQLVLLLTGALLMGGGAVGLVVFGEEGAEALYAITFASTTQELPVADNAWTGTGTFEFDVTATNVTELVVTVTCAESTPVPIGTAAPATVTVTVTGPNGLTGDGSGRCGSDVVVEVPVGSTPSSTTATGTSEADAVRSLPGSFTTTNATGAWTVEVSAARAQNIPGAPQPGGQVTVEVARYEAAAQAAPVR